ARERHREAPEGPDALPAWQRARTAAEAVANITPTGDIGVTARISTIPGKVTATVRSAGRSKLSGRVTAYEVRNSGCGLRSGCGRRMWGRGHLPRQPMHPRWMWGGVIRLVSNCTPPRVHASVTLRVRPGAPRPAS